MRIKKVIDKNLVETEVLIKSPTEEQYRIIVEKIEEKLSFATVDGLILISKHDILYIKTQKNYLELVTKDETFKIRSPLYRIEKRLDDDFVKVSRSYLINFKNLVKLDTDLLLGVVAYVDDFKIPVSKNYLKNIKAKILKLEGEKH